MLLRLANKVPIDFAFPTRNLVGARPKIGATDRINLSKDLSWDVERREVVNGNGSENSFDKDGPTGGSNMSSLSRREFASHLILKVLKVDPLEALDR